MKTQKSEKYACFFNSAILKDNLKQRSIRSGITSAFSQGAMIVLRFGSVIVLARLLIPEHFGLITMVTALTVFVERFQDLGLGDATIQKNEITHAQVSALFWINLLVCLFFTVLIACLSKAVAWFYHDNRLISITILYSINFTIAGLSIQHIALLKRQMRFGAYNTIMISSTAIGLGIAILLAVKGYGYWALVWKEVARNVSCTLGAWLFCPWLPSRIIRKAGIRELLHFAKNVTGFNIIIFFANQFDSILIGRFAGPISLGIYSRALQLTAMPISQLQAPLSNVALPAMSSLQTDHDRIRRYFGRMIELLSFLYMPIPVFIGLFAQPIVLLLLGPKWIETIPFFRLFAIAAFAFPLVQTTGLVMVALGKTKRYFYWGIWQGCTIILCLSIGIIWGPIGVANGYIIASWLNLVFTLCLFLRGLPVTTKTMISATFRPAISSAIMGIIILIGSQYITLTNGLLNIGFFAAIGCIVYLLAWGILPGGKKRLIEMLSYSTFIVRGKNE